MFCLAVSQCWFFIFVAPMWRRGLASVALCLALVLVVLNVLDAIEDIQTPLAV